MADDEKLITNLLKRCLEDYGYSVGTAADGKEALDLLRSQEFELLITDVRMPRLDGMQLLKAAKDLYPRLPVIMISGYGEAEIVVEALKSGAENFLAKPLDLDSLEHVVKRTLAMASIQPRRCALPTVWQRTRLETPSRPECVHDVVYQLALSAVAVGFASPDLDNDIKLALVEAVTNAMEHGNQWDESKLVQVEAEMTSGEIKVTVKDLGAGFDHRRQLNPTAAERLLSERGRGVFLMQSIMDEVVYNQAGNQVTLIKRKTPKEGCD
ncbi:MAG: response regulator [Desulfarculaceae bacterium]|nr:response regulator [Desulfarculaceae bacterium]MCF8072328.1 response regulator [Desulfarculaceae bacterium]MCF8100249.1 response regulator [Desulfarculaceae bacterium]MCF8116178.1 response regulator [Desulfarculaceae bacterium]